MPNSEEDIFCDALDVPFASREKFVREACAGDLDLFASVKRLLQLHDTGDEFLATPAIGLNAAELEEKPGDLIGSYRLDKKIGEGGFGIVWKADQLKPVKRSVAIKFFKLGMDAEQVVRRFDEERQTLAIMNHPNIATVLDAGTTGCGRSFIAMELVEGTSVDRYCDENSLSISKRLNLFISVCRAVQHAHQKGVIHLDLKPSNILVADQDGQPFVKIIDFGIAKAVQCVGPEFGISRESQEDSIDRFQLIGTPVYMSPEQLETPRQVDTRSDIYSLGAVLYKLLAGVTPLDMSGIEEPDGLNNCIQLLRDIVPVAPSIRLEERAKSTFRKNSQLNGSIENIPEDLDCITLKALHKEPAGRYQSANEMAKDIERYLSCQIVSAADWTIPYAFKKFVLRNRLFVVATLLVLLATVGGLISMSIGLVQAENQRSIAVSERKEAEKHRARAESLRNLAIQEAEEAKLVANLLEQIIGGANPEAGLPADFSLREQLDEVSALIDDRLKNYPEIEARLRHTIGRAYSNLRILEKAGTNLRRALELRLRVLPPVHSLVMESRLELARFLVFDANASEARVQVELVMEELESLEPSLNLAKAHHVLSEINSRTGLPLETFLSAEKAWQIARASAGPNELLTLDYQSRAGFCAIRVESLKRAEQLVSDALKGLQNHWPNRPFEINRAKGRLVTVLAMQKRFDEALPLINQVIEENVSQLGNESHYHVTAMLAKVNILRHLDRREEAEDLLWKTAATADRATNERSRAQTIAYRRLAEWVQRDDRPAEAEVLWSKAIDARRKMDGNTSRVSQELIIRGCLLRELGRNQEAANCLAEAVAVLRTLEQPAKNTLLDALYHQADQKLELGLAVKALEPLGEAVVLAEELARPAVYPHIDYIQALIESDQIELARQNVKAWETNATEQSDEVMATIVQVVQLQLAMSQDEYEPASIQLADTIRDLKSQPDTNANYRMLARVSGLLAECYIELNEFELAEKILLKNAKGTRRVPTGIDSRRAKRLLVSLYQSWEKPELAARWRKRIYWE